MTRAFVGLGGNSVRASRHLSHALRRLRRNVRARFVGASAVYQTAPQGCPGRQRDYCNCVVELQTVQSPRRLFLELQKMERDIQRRRRRRNAPRRLDADYLLHGRARLRAAALTLPHPRMLSRAFVLTPLAEITGDNFTGLRNADQLRAARRACQNQPLHRLQLRH